MRRYELVACFLLASVFLGATAYQSFTAPTPGPVIDVPAARDMFTDAIVSSGPREAYREFLDAHQNARLGTQHLMSHLFGEILFEVEGVSGVHTCDSSFDYGCFHGFFIRAMSQEGLSFVAALADACRSGSADMVSSCEHGIGHGLVEFMGGERIHDALQVCADVDSSATIGGCFSGVFMQYNVPQHITEDGKIQANVRQPLDLDAPYDPCPSLEEEFKPACYHTLPQWWQELYASNYDRIGGWCDHVPDQAFRTTCFHGLGVVIASGASFEPREIISSCHMIRTDDGKDLCLRVAASSVQLRTGDHLSAHTVCAVRTSSAPPCPEEVSALSIP